MSRFTFETKQISAFMAKLCLLLMGAGALVVITIPWWLNIYLHWRYVSFDMRLYATMLVLLAVSGISAVFILYHGRKILLLIAGSDPFTEDTARRVAAISYWCLPIALVYLLGVFAVASPFILLVGIAFLFAAVLVRILSELFMQAARYKQENDLTI